MILLTVGWLGIAVMFLVNTVRQVSVGYQAMKSFWERNVVHFCAKMSDTKLQGPFGEGIWCIFVPKCVGYQAMDSFWRRNLVHFCAKIG